MSEFLTVGKTTEFRLDDGFFAIDNLCLHQAGPLCEGEIQDVQVQLTD